MATDVSAIAEMLKSEREYLASLLKKAQLRNTCKHSEIKVIKACACCGIYLSTEIQEVKE